MGDLTGDSRYPDGSTSELPIRQVTIKEPFEMGKYEVTIAEFNAYLRANGWDVYGDEDRYGNHPITRVSLGSAKKYAKWLSEQTGSSFRLPSEEEWDYAARAGTETNFYWGNNPSGQHANGDQYAGAGGQAFRRRWNLGRPDDGYYGTAPVGTLIPNAFGLYDMSGNVLYVQWHIALIPAQIGHKGRNIIVIPLGKDRNQAPHSLVWSYPVLDAVAELVDRKYVIGKTAVCSLNQTV